MTNKFLIALINFYQKFISPLRPASCRFTPTCSEYAKGVIVNRSLLLAILLIIVRIFRCNPWSKGGYDPVPTKYSPVFTKQNYIEKIVNNKEYE